MKQVFFSHIRESTSSSKVSPKGSRADFLVLFLVVSVQVKPLYTTETLCNYNVAFWAFGRR